MLLTHYFCTHTYIFFFYSYDLAIQPDLDAFTFTGTVQIIFRVDASKLDESNATQVTLHAKELLFESAEYVVVGQQPQDAAAPVKAEEIIVNLKFTTVKFIFPTPIPAGNNSTEQTIKLTVHYSGFLNNQMAGFYRSSYQDIAGNTKIMASTQFEALDARRAFPCIDEPAVKAIFGLTLTIPAALLCISNMPAASSVSLKSSDTNLLQKRVQFMDSPKMSTYLLAFCVGEFDSVAATSTHGVLIQVYTPPGKAASGQFALDCAVRSLDAYDDFFNIHYPLPKLDMVAIPEFAAGAMENWGLITYREVDLLIDPVTASSQQKQRVATVVTHELAHQWFGNLVTMDWWSGLWLNGKYHMCWGLCLCVMKDCLCCHVSTMLDRLVLQPFAQPALLCSIRIPTEQNHLLLGARTGLQTNSTLSTGCGISSERDTSRRPCV
jgi:aminopeptidase N